MCPLNFKSRSRGGVTLFALLSVTLLLGTALSHTAYVTMVVKGNQSAWFSLQKKEALLNGIHQIRAARGPGESDWREGGRLLEYLWMREQGGMLETDRILVDVDGEPHWPQVVGLWIQTPNTNLYLKDYWRE